MAKASFEAEKGFISEKAFPKVRFLGKGLVLYRSRYGYVVRSVSGNTPGRERVLSVWREWLFWMNQIFKVTHPEILMELRRQEKLSGIKDRDIWSSAMNGLLFYLEDETGRRVYSMAHVERISRSLDVFSQEVGAILVRDQDVWRALSPGPDGSILVSRGPGQLPEWGAPSVGGFGGVVLVDINRPKEADFSVLRPGRPGSEVIWRPYGAVLRSAAGGGTDPTVLMHSEVLPAEFNVVVGLVGDFTQTGDQNKGGLALYSPVNQAAVAFTIYNDILAIQYYHNTFSLEGRVAGINYRFVPGVLVFLRIEQAADGRRFYVSSNGVDWVRVFSRSIDHATELLRFCVLVDARNASSDFLTHFVHYSIS